MLAESHLTRRTVWQYGAADCAASDTDGIAEAVVAEKRPRPKKMFMRWTSYRAI